MLTRQQEKFMNERLQKLKGKKIITFDAETNGLWGNPFAIAAVVYDENGDEMDRLCVRCPIDGEVDSFVQSNVLPVMEHITITHDDMVTMISSFIDFVHRYPEAIALVHMGHVVESYIFRIAYQEGLIQWNGAPYEWFDTCLLFGDSVNAYVMENKVHVGQKVDATHDPLYDAISNYKAFRHLVANVEKI